MKNMARVFLRRRFFLLLISSRLFAQVGGQWCYYPGGEDKALQQYPCNPYAYTTLCCPLGWTCFSNNLCVVTDETAVGDAYPVGTASRGTCTNPAWNDTACGDFCLDETGWSNNGSLQSCGGGNWCCQSSADAGTCNCESGEGTFSIPDGYAQTVIGVTGSGSASTSSAIASTTASRTSSVLYTTSSKPTSTTSRISGSSSSPKSTLTSLTSPLTSSHTNAPSPTSQTSQSSGATGSPASATTTSAFLSVTQKPGFKAGISVAVIFIVFAIAGFLVWFFWYRRRNRDNPNIPGSDVNSDIYTPEPMSAVPGPILRPNPDPYEYRGSDSLRLSPVSDSGAGRGRATRNEGWSGGFSGGFAGRATDERLRPVVNPYRMPYEGT